MARVLGIDPGLSGALALWDEDLGALSVWDMPTHTIKVGKANKRVLDEQALVALVLGASPDYALVEWVHAMPRQGVSSVFTFGVGFGIVRGILAACGISVTYVTPNVWMKAMRVAAGKDGSRQRASQLLPRYAHLFARAKDDGRSDATLIVLAHLNGSGYTVPP